MTPSHSKRSLQLALLLFVCTTPYPTTAEELGRLFFTPERRQQLDHQRQFNIEERSEAADDPTLTINGIVLRSSGKNTTWINGIARESQQYDGLTVSSRKKPGHVAIHTEGMRTVEAKVGDRINSTTGESAGLIGNGLLSIDRKPSTSRQVP